MLSIALVVGGWYAGQTILLDHFSPSAQQFNLRDARAPVRPDEPMRIRLAGAGAELQSVRLYRAETLDGANNMREAPVAVKAEPDGELSWRIVAADGQATALRPDGAYRLVVQSIVPRPALPTPRLDLREQQYRFTTVPGPMPTLPADVLRPRWNEAVALDWSAPIESIVATAHPATSLRTWVDEKQPTRTWFQVGDGERTAGQSFDVTITQARSRDGLDMQRPASIKVTMPVQPRIVDAPTAPVTLKYGERITMNASDTLVDPQVVAHGDVAIAPTFEGSRIEVSLPQYVQGASFSVEVARAFSPRGAPLAAPARVQVRTPAAFAQPTLSPKDGASGVSPTTRPTVTFGGAVADRDAAVRALSIEPEVPGEWTWVAPDKVEFVPEGRLPFLEEFTITFRGGPESARSVEGGYVEDDVTTTFTTAHYKRIEVDLARQMLHMLEDDKVIRSVRVATGVRGAETPTGWYQVEYKMPVARFQGVNPSGLRYDIPDVKWVLAFLGDYTIHGAYWRSSFGTPGSNGCVTMPDVEAKVLYDWADPGTPIKIA